PPRPPRLQGRPRSWRATQSPAASVRRRQLARQAIARREPGPRRWSLGSARVAFAFMGPTGRITDEGVERLRARIGIPEPHPMPPYYTLPTHDTFRNVAVAYGDDNPLWCDPEYG